MRFLLYFLAFACFLSVQAQCRYADELQLTETRFALESQIHGLKWGFLHNMDTTALGFNNKGFASLYSAWKDRPEQSSYLLQWKPTALWSSEDGLFGLTTGPYFTRGSKDSAVLANGYFFTIWQRPNTAVPYRFVVDAGVQMIPGIAPSVFTSTPVEKASIAKAAGKLPTSPQLVSKVQSFRNKSAKESLRLALKDYTQEKSFLLVSDFGRLPIHELDKVTVLNRRMDIQPIGHKDLSSGCCYEWGQLRSADDASLGPLTGYYVHVWQLRGQQPLLLAAVYKFDQSVK